MSPVAVRVLRLRVEHFRNLATGEVALDAPLVVFHGENGEGKTNSLEALHYLATLKPLRGRRTRELVRFGERSAALSAEVACGPTRTLVAVAKWSVVCVNSKDVVVSRHKELPTTAPRPGHRYVSLDAPAAVLLGSRLRVVLLGACLRAVASGAAGG